MCKGFVSAMRTLSAIPIPGRDAEKMTASLPWFPVVGAVLGGILYGMWWLLHASGLGGWSEGTALVLVAAAAVLTRGLHLDGLADAADGLFSMTGRTRTLEIMKDPRVGTFGVLCLMLTLGLKWVALKRLVEHEWVIWMVPVSVVSRAVMVELAVSLPYARIEGGTGAPFVRDAGTRHRVLGWMIAAILVAPAGPLAFLTPALGYIAAKILGRIYTRRLGGVTGDLLGAASEIVEIALLLFGASLVATLEDTAWWELFL